MKYWSVKNNQPQETIDFRALGLTEWEYRVLLNRGLDTKNAIEEYIHPSMEHIASPITMKDMVKAGNILQSVKGKVRIVGDYDCDGTMSTTILLKGLKGLGYDVDYDIPHRRKDGYGMQVEMADEAAKDGVELIITCDNGIAQFDAIRRCKELGIKVIVIDHHQVVKKDGEEILPEADAIINPHQEQCRYPFKELCGGALSYYFINYLYTISGKIEELDLDLIGFAAIATICDVMILKGENRNLTIAGLERLNRTDHIGFNALREAASIRGDVAGYHIGFIIGPTINAAGRLETAKDAVELFLTDDESFAQKTAIYLRDLNAKRQALTIEGTKRLEAQLQSPKEREQLLYILKDETIDESIAGIIAGKLKSKYNRPCIVITRGENGLKGSGRSIEAYNMVENIRKSEEYLTSFGGHAMACGLSLNRDRFVPFKLDALEKCGLNERDLIPRIRLDAIVSIDKVSFETVSRLERFQPYGNGNPKPLFGATGIYIRDFKIFGKNKNVIKLTLHYKGRDYDGILFKDGDEFIAFTQTARRSDGSLLVDIAYVPTIDTYRDKNTLQLQIEELRLSKHGD
ncbi:single-stranded-DNA-specific exonuclease RecJ [Aedoeadaptatus coxii]|uniref:Single-stranded-DNA-specific exonuclease RecJ n=1 Tax=Aedoeadaptatus coxii TaxID=755172 RepID=A0A134ABI7_9FIRM|nr:single-stranded-DNA-specific exonuclease RecJ [Peptoniphilus coxii]KXB65028.1 single-stranded-DNA-specific exonuclease RecJ [Peptoniphilus coxii]